MEEENGESEQEKGIRTDVPIPESGIGTRISEISAKAGGKKALARKAGISESHLYRYISGQSEPSASKLVAIADAAACSITWLATGKGPKRRGLGLDLVAEKEAEYEAAQGHPAVDIDIVEKVVSGLEARYEARGVHPSPEAKGRIVRLVLEYLEKEGKPRNEASLDNIIDLATFR